jgi:hypothetical protein
VNTWWVITDIVQWVVIVGLAVMNAVLFRQLGIMVMGAARGVESSGIPLGKRPPPGRLADVAGGTWSPEDWRGSPFMIFFAGTYCSECAGLMPVLRELHDNGLRLTVMLFNNGPDDVSAYLAAHDVPGTVVPADQETGHRYDAVAVPFAYAIGARGEVVFKGLAGNRGRLQEFAEHCGVTDPAAPDAVAQAQ